MTTHEKLIASRTNEQLIADWVTLDNQPMTQAVAEVRGWMMAEVERRWPDEYSNWMECEDPDDDIRKFITL